MLPKGDKTFICLRVEDYFQAIPSILLWTLHFLFMTYLTSQIACYCPTLSISSLLTQFWRLLRKVSNCIFMLLPTSPSSSVKHTKCLTLAQGLSEIDFVNFYLNLKSQQVYLMVIRDVIKIPHTFAHERISLPLSQQCTQMFKMANNPWLLDPNLPVLSCVAVPSTPGVSSLLGWTSGSVGAGPAGGSSSWASSSSRSTSSTFRLSASKTHIIMCRCVAA